MWQKFKKGTMAERPTPRSLAVCALIALHSDPSSAFHDIEFNPHEQQNVNTFLEESVFRDPTNADQSLKTWMDKLQHRLGQGLFNLLTDTLIMVSESFDSLVNLMESLAGAIGEGLVDAVSSHGVYLRQICLGFEELSFESSTLLWRDLKDQLAHIDEIHDSNEETSDWPLSTPQVETIVRESCHTLHQGSTGQSYEAVELQVRQMLLKDPETPGVYFLRFLNCLRHGERVGAINALHQYFDHAMVKNTSPKDILQFSSILLSLAHTSFGDRGLALMATEEAVRVAQQSNDAACVAFALGWLFETEGHGTSQRNELLKRCAERATQGQLQPLVAGANLTLGLQYMNDRADPATTWLRLMAATSEQAADSLPTLDQPAFMTKVPKDTMNNLARKGLVSAGVWDAFAMPALSGLASLVATKFHTDMSAEERLAAVQQISRLGLYGTLSNVLSNKPQNEVSTQNRSIHMDVATNILESQNDKGHDGTANLDDSSLFNVALVLLELTVNSGDLEGAQALLVVLDSSVHPGLRNKDELEVDLGIQKCRLLCRKQNWVMAQEVATTMRQLSETKGLPSHHVRVLIQLAYIELESNPNQVTAALGPLLEALSICEESEMHGLHAVSLSVLAIAHLRLKNPQRALAILKAAFPTLLRREHVWFQAEAYLTNAKCHLQLAGKSEGTKKKRLQAALASLKQCQTKFEQCQDMIRLREVFYLKAQVFSALGDLAEREVASKQFLDVCETLKTRRRSDALQILTNPGASAPVPAC